MKHFTLQPYARSKHPGTTKAGNLGFYTIVGVAVVTLLLGIGLYFIAQNALLGLASIAGAAPGS